MSIVETVIGLVLLVLLSNLINHYFKSIPVSLIQIILGTIVALIFNLKIDLESSWFLLLFIAPLLYNDGRKFPKEELWKLKGAIFNNAIILVFITMMLGGYLIHLIIPALPLPVGIALAAILAPTDPVAVHSISKQVKLPDNILHLVSGESLINDASGLIGFKYAVMVAVTGYFSLKTALVDLFYFGLVGFVAGFVLITIVVLIIEWLIVKGFNDVVFNTVLQLCVPFIIYLLTEESFHASGVIAVVVAGVVFASKRNSFIRIQPEINIVSERMWDLIVYLLNGIMFTILGVELPVAMHGTIENEDINTFSAIFFVFVMWGILLLIRIVWTYCYQLFTDAKAKSMKERLKVALLSGISGVRGAITMAGALTIPTQIASGEAFPERSLVLFIAAGVIILSMVVAIIVLPFISGDVALQTRGGLGDLDANKVLETTEDEDEDEQLEISSNKAKLYILKTAVRSLEGERRMGNELAVYHLILEYQFMIKRLEVNEYADDLNKAATSDEIKLHKVALRGQLNELERLHQTNQIQEKVYHKFKKSLKNQLKRADHKAKIRQEWPFPTIMESIRKFWRSISLWVGIRQDEKYGVGVRLVERSIAKAAIKALSEYLKNPEVNEKKINREVIYHMIITYRSIIERQKSEEGLSGKDYQEQVRRLRFKSIAAQRAALQYLVEQGYVNHQAAISLRQYINHEESLNLRASILPS
ncbi:sodium:proton antiporter [Liquorilactobacillus mali]|uniref:NhaP-type Na+ H+ and K+ H+ antiporter n=1 Tax=Liquorilactobacillus mali TaxID=1618 RepID=A0A0R2FTK9_9LACO|nr:sodium:proton antiporter [Liquorilactobacillus mali]KRN28522.1 NhaP-type Na+ H+ and K+ H+ antiporter [Liquorilactobacillus mali]MDN7146169.1 sodium:proton antiporter [Liquorilactobacillus mali]